MSLLPLFYIGIIFVGVIRLSNGYTEFQRCIDPRKFDRYLDRFLKGVKTSVNPCTNFYEYGCGNWSENNPNPVGYVIWSTYQQIQHKTFHRVHKLLIKEDENDTLPFIKIAKQYHRSCMNEEVIEDEGLKPIKLMLKETGEWPILQSRWYKDKYIWQNTYETYNKLYGFSNIFRIDYKRDELNQSRNVFMIYHSIGNEEQFLKDTCRYVKANTITKIIRAFAADEKINIPISALRHDVSEIIKFEKNLIQIINQVNITEVTRMTIAGLQNFYNSFTQTGKTSLKINWLDIIQSSFEDINFIINTSDPVLVNKEFFRKTADLLDVTSPYIILNYVQWNMVCRLRKYLNKQVRNIEPAFHLNSNVMKRSSRWLTCVQDEFIQHIMSYLYIKTYISADILKAVSEMSDEIKAEIKERISLSPWMSNATKNDMMNKLEKVLLHIGYPKWYDNETVFIEHYKGLELGEKYFENLLAIAKHERKKYATVTDSNIDMYSWRIYPIVAVAVYVTWENKIVIPAALIQDPFFTFNRPSALNYGAIGFIIGHELAHSLDLSKARHWKCLIDHYNNITREQGVINVDGKPIVYGNLALAENIPDIIGVQAAFAAFQKKKAKMERQSKLWILENITDEQLFFLSFANIMCISTKVRDIIIRKFSGQSPEIRLIASLSNTKSYSEAFMCRTDSPMNPLSKCKIWE